MPQRVWLRFVSAILDALLDAFGLRLLCGLRTCGVFPLPSAALGGLGASLSLGEGSGSARGAPGSQRGLREIAPDFLCSRGDI